MRRAFARTTEDLVRRWQELRRKSDGLGAIEIAIDKPSRSLSQEHAEIRLVLREPRRDLLVRNAKFLPALLDRSLLAERDGNAVATLCALLTRGLGDDTQLDLARRRGHGIALRALRGVPPDAANACNVVVWYITVRLIRMTWIAPDRASAHIFRAGIGASKPMSAARYAPAAAAVSARSGASAASDTCGTGGSRARSCTSRDEESACCMERAPRDERREQVCLREENSRAREPCTIRVCRRILTHA